MSTVENRGSHLFVAVTGPYTLKLFRSTIRDVAEGCHKENLDKALIDLTEVAGSPSILDRYHLGIEIARVWGWRIKAAVVAKPSIINYMAETVAVNRGARFKVFAETREAKKWPGTGE